VSHEIVEHLIEFVHLGNCKSDGNCPEEVNDSRVAAVCGQLNSLVDVGEVAKVAQVRLHFANKGVNKAVAKGRAADRAAKDLDAFQFERKGDAISDLYECLSSLILEYQGVGEDLMGWHVVP
jgi:hypothetical protein